MFWKLGMDNFIKFINRIKLLAKIHNIKNLFNKLKIIQGNIKDIEKEVFSFYTTEEYYDEDPMPKG